MPGKLGSLIGVDVRSFWPNEASDFTPWLAQPDNLATLGKAVGLEREVEQTEVAVGPYAADILARNSADDSYVIIENQLAKTNHDHLGKSLTYAAGLGAKTVVWIAADFTNEHRKALDWLNDNSSEEIAFYGVQLELWSIDGSSPAVRFNVVSRPALQVAPNAGLSDTKKLQLEWWTAFRDELLAQKALPSAQSPKPRYWYNVALGRAGIHLSAFANTFDNRIGMRVYMMGKYNGPLALQQLLEARDAIEKDIGVPLVWDPNPEATDKVIAVYRDANLACRPDWPDHLKWLVEMTIRFRKTFGPRVKALDLDGTPGEPESAV